MVIKRFTNILGSKRSSTNPFRFGSSDNAAASGSNEDDIVETPDTPEGNVGRGVRLFCESGGPNNVQGEEVLHLPVIVDGAESSPQAAAVAAQQIRKFLSKENYSRPHVQYNAVMLIRILADNPGATFTRNMDGKFTSTVKDLLRNGKDPSVQQILRETLAALYQEKAYDTNLTALFQMWGKEQGPSSPTARAPNGPSAWHQPALFNNQPPHENYQRRQREAGLPPPAELAARIEEAKTSAKLLQQLVQSTPTSELQDNELIKEFSERCQTAQRSVQGYINATDPSPDDDTMQTLIETSELLSLAASKHQRAVLQARRSGASTSPQPQDVYAPPEQPPTNTGYSSPTAPPTSTYVPTAAPQLSAYSPPPIPPPSMRANLERRSTQEGVKAMPLPPSLQSGTAPTGSKPATVPFSEPPQIPASIPADPIELPNPGYDNPFSDKHESIPQSQLPYHSRLNNVDPHSASEYEDEDEDPYHAPPYAPPGATSGPTSSTLATVGSRPAPRQAADSWRKPVPGKEESYHPGYTSTPSYVQRQESAGENLTMHGGAVSPEKGENHRNEERGAISPIYERNSGEISPVEARYSGAGGGAAAGYRY